MGGDYLGLAIVRSLGRHGVPVCVVDDELSIARFSRYTTHHVRVPDLREESACVAALLGVARRLGLDGWVVYPTREEIVVALARRRAELLARFRIPTQPWDVTRVAWDKRETQALAERIGVATARTWVVGGVDELVSIPEDARYPLVIKPAIKENFLYATGAKAWRADTRAELASRVEAAAAIVGPREVLVQERIPGDGTKRYAYCTFFKDGRSVAAVTVRRQRQHPPEFGRASTLVETIDVPELEASAVRFLRAMGFYGVAELEFMHDERDGTYKLLDVNARLWGYHSIGPVAGVDFPWLLFEDQAGMGMPATVRGRTGVRWIRLLTDVPTAAVELRQGSLSLWSYLRSLWPMHSEAVFSWRDPLPGVAELGLLPYLIAKRGF
jgi:predicted ATP-grasp superfamily ATP-dependent carboligase